MKKGLAVLALAALGWLLPEPLSAQLVKSKPVDWSAFQVPVSQVPNHRDVWREVVIELGSYAKARNRNFLVLARNGVELIVKGEREADWEALRYGAMDWEKRLPAGSIMRPYVKVVDGLVLDGLYCGPNKFDKPLAQAIKERKEADEKLAAERRQGIKRPPEPQPVGPFSIDPREELRKADEVRVLTEKADKQRRMIYAITAMKDAGKPVFSLNDCAAKAEVEAAWKAADRDRLPGYAGQDLGSLRTVPKARPHAENSKAITSLTQASNFMPVSRGDGHGTRAEWVLALEDTNHDVVMVDMAHRGLDGLTKADVAKLKFKKMGPPRLAIAVMPLGKAWDSRWYWQKGWEAGQPPMLFAPVDGEPGAFYTDLTSPQWKKLLGTMITGIVDLGFDGVVFTELDTYLWFEDIMPLTE